jgi:hypothetical protein
MDEIEERQIKMKQPEKSLTMQPKDHKLKRLMK